MTTVGARSLIKARIGSLMTQQLENPFSPFVASVVARGTTASVVEHFVAHVVRGEV